MLKKKTSISKKTKTSKTKTKTLTKTAKTSKKKGKSKTKTDSETRVLRTNLWYDHIYLAAPLVSLVPKYGMTHQALSQHLMKAALDLRIQQICELRSKQQKQKNELSFK